MNMTSQSPFNQTRRASLGKALKLLYEKHGELIYAKVIETDTAAKFKIEKQIEEVETQIQSLESKLNKLNAIERDPNFFHQNLHHNITKINYKKAITLVDKTVSGFGQEGGAAVFLLQNCLPMGGEWCVTRIKENLKAQTGDFKPYPIHFTVESQPDEYGLLNRLAPFFNIEPILDSWSQYACKIIDKVCDSVVSGSIVFFEINQWDNLTVPDHILKLYLNEFWSPLIQSLPRLVEKKKCRRVKFVTVITANSNLPDTCFHNDYCCSSDEFCSEKMRSLELTQWTEEEIVEWLEIYSGFDGYRIDQIVPKILETSYGIPRMVYHSLMTYLNPMKG